MDFSDHRTLIVAYTLSNIAGAFMLLCSWKRPTTARIFYFLLFLWASWTNGRYSIYSPEVYLDYANYTFMPLYKNFIQGTFRPYTTPIIFTIAICQFFIAVSMLLRENFFKAGCWGGITFLLCISPLGIGAAFPASLTMAFGFYLLLKKQDHRALLHRLEKRSPL